MPEDIYTGGQKEGDLFSVNDSLLQSLSKQVVVNQPQAVEQEPVSNQVMPGSEQQLETTNELIQKEEDPIYSLISSLIDESDDYERDNEEQTSDKLFNEMNKEKSPYGELNYEYVLDKYSKLNEPDNTSVFIEKPFSAQENLENMVKTAQRHNDLVDNNNFDFRTGGISPDGILSNMQFRKNAEWTKQYGDKIKDTPEIYQVTPNTETEQQLPEIASSVQQYADSITKDKTLLKDFIYEYYKTNSTFPTPEVTNDYFFGLVEKDSYNKLTQTKLVPPVNDFIKQDPSLERLLTSSKYINGTAYEKSVYLMNQINSTPAYKGKENQIFDSLENYRYPSVDVLITKQIAYQTSKNISSTHIMRSSGFNGKEGTGRLSQHLFYPSAHFFNTKFGSNITDEELEKVVSDAVSGTRMYSPTFTLESDKLSEDAKNYLYQSLFNTKESEILSIAKSRANEVLDMDFDSENRWFQNLGTGLKYGWKDAIPMVSPILNYAEAKTLNRALEKLKDGEELTPAEEILTKSQGNYNNFTALNPETFWYEAGKRLIPQSIGFIADYMLTSGIGAEARVAAQSAIKSFGKRLFLNTELTNFHPFAVKSLSTVYEHFLVRTPLSRMDDMIADIEQRLIPSNSYYFDRDSQEFYNKVAYVNNDTFLEAALKSYLEEGVGSWTESLGGVIAPAIVKGSKYLSEPVVNFLSKRLAQPPVVVKGIFDFLSSSRDFANRSFFNFMTKWDTRFIEMPKDINASRFFEEFLAKKSDTFLKSAGVHSFPAEYIEEFINNRISPLIEGQDDEFFKDMGGTMLKEIAQTAVALAPIVGFSHVLNIPYYAKSFKFRNSSDKSLFNTIKVYTESYNSEEFSRNEAGIIKAINNLKDDVLKTAAERLFGQRQAFENGELGNVVEGQTYGNFLKLKKKEVANYQRIVDSIVQGKIATESELEDKLSSSGIMDNELLSNIRKEYESYDNFVSKQTSDKAFKFKYESYSKYRDTVLKRAYKIQSNLVSYINDETKILDFNAVEEALADNVIPPDSKKLIKSYFDIAKKKLEEKAGNSPLITFENQELSVGNLKFKKGDGNDYSIHINDNEVVQVDKTAEATISSIIKSNSGSIEPESIFPLYVAINNSDLSKEAKASISTDLITSSFKALTDSHTVLASTNYKGIISILRGYEDILKDASLPKIKALVNKYIYTAFKAGVYNETISKKEANDFIHNFALMVDLADSKNISLMKAYISKVESGRGKKEAEEEFEFEGGEASVTITESPFSNLQKALDKIKVKENFKFSDAAKNNPTLRKIQEALKVAVDNGQIRPYQRNLIYEMLASIPEVLLDGIVEITHGNAGFSYVEGTGTINLGNAEGAIFVWSFLEEVVHHIEFNLGIKIGKGINMSDENMKKITGYDKANTLKSIVEHYKSLSTKDLMSTTDENQLRKKFEDLKVLVKSLLQQGTKIPNGVELTDDVIDDSLGRISSFIDAGYSLPMAIYYGTSYEEFFARTLADALISDAIRKNIKKSSTISKIINSVTNWKIRNFYAPFLQKMFQYKDTFPTESISEVGLNSKLLDDLKFSDSSKKNLFNYFNEIAEEFFGANPVFTLNDDGKPEAQTSTKERGSFIKAENNNYIALAKSEQFSEDESVKAVLNLAGNITPENEFSANTALAIAINAGDEISTEDIKLLSKEHYAQELMFLLKLRNPKTALNIALQNMSSDYVEQVQHKLGSNYGTYENMFNRLFVSKDLRNATPVRGELTVSSEDKLRIITDEFATRNAYHISDFETLDFSLNIDSPIWLLEDEEYHPCFPGRLYQYKVDVPENVKVIDLTKYQSRLRIGTKAHEELFNHFANAPVVFKQTRTPDNYILSKINAIVMALNQVQKGLGAEFVKELREADAIRGHEAGFTGLTSLYVLKAGMINITEKNEINKDDNFWSKLKLMVQNYADEGTYDFVLSNINRLSQTKTRGAYNSDAFAMAALNFNNNDKTIYFDSQYLQSEDAAVLSLYLPELKIKSKNLFEDILLQYNSSPLKSDLLDRLKTVSDWISDGVLTSKIDDFINLFDYRPNVRNSFTVWHASPFEFNRFDMTHIGRGEGTQMEGAGMYFATDPAEAEIYLHMRDLKLYDENDNEIKIDFNYQQEKLIRTAGSSYIDYGSIGKRMEKNKDVQEFISALPDVPKEGQIYEDFVDLIKKLRTAKKFRTVSYLYEGQAFDGKQQNEYYKNIFDFTKPVDTEVLERLLNAESPLGLNINLWRDKDIAKNLIDGGMNLKALYRQIERVSNRFMATELLKRAGFVGVMYPAEFAPGSWNYVLFYPEQDVKIKKVERFSFDFDSSNEKLQILKSKEFKEWFGDWETNPNSPDTSKMLDSEGKPLLVYHGTNKVFDKFSKEFKGVNTGDTPLGYNTKSGFFFLDDKTKAQSFTQAFGDGSIIVEAVLNLKKPLDITIYGLVTKKEQALDILRVMMSDEETMLDEGVETDEDALNWLNDNLTPWKIGEFLATLTSEESVERFKELGYDGAISDFGGSILEYIAFEPESIRILDNEKFVFNEDIYKHIIDNFTGALHNIFNLTIPEIRYKYGSRLSKDLVTVDYKGIDEQIKFESSSAYAYAYFNPKGYTEGETRSEMYLDELSRNNIEDKSTKGAGAVVLHKVIETAKSLGADIVTLRTPAGALDTLKQYYAQFGFRAYSGIGRDGVSDDAMELELNYYALEKYSYNKELHQEVERGSFYKYGSSVDISNFISFAEHAKKQGSIITPLQIKQIIKDIDTGVTQVANANEYTRSIVAFYKDYYLRNSIIKQGINLTKKDLTYLTHTPNRKTIDSYQNDIDIIEKVASDIKFRNLMLAVRNEIKKSKSVYQRNKTEDLDFYSSLRLLTKVNPKMFKDQTSLQEFYDYLKYRPGAVSNAAYKQYADAVFAQHLDEFGKADYQSSDPALASQDDIDAMIDTIELLINSFQTRINYSNQDVREFIDIDLQRLNFNELKQFYSGVVYIIRNNTVNDKIFDFTQKVKAKFIYQDFVENKQNFYLDILNEKTARDRWKDVYLGFFGGYGNIKLYGIHDLTDLIDSGMTGKYDGLFYNSIARPMIDNSARHDNSMNDVLDDIEAPEELRSRGSMNTLGIYSLLHQKPYFKLISNKVATFLNDSLSTSEFVEGDSISPNETDDIRKQAYELLTKGVNDYIRKSIIVSLGGAEEIGMSKAQANLLLKEMNIASGITNAYIKQKVKHIKEYLKSNAQTISELVSEIETRALSQVESDYINTVRTSLNNIKNGTYSDGVTLEYASKNYSGLEFNEIDDYIPIIRYKDFYDMFKSEDFANISGIEVAFKMASNANINEDFIFSRVNAISAVETNLHKMVRTRADQQLFYLHNAKFGMFLKKLISSDLFKEGFEDESFNRHSAALILKKIDNYFERGFSPSKLALNKVAAARFINNGMNNLKVLYTGAVYKSLAQVTSVITNMQGLNGSVPRRMADTMFGLKTAIQYYNNKEYEAFLRQASPEVFYRGIGDYDLNNSYRDTLFGKYKNIITELMNTKQSDFYKEVHGSKFRKFALASVVFFDKFAAVSSWYSAYNNYLSTRGLSFDVNSINQEAADFATNVVANTQSSDNQIYRGASQQGIGIGSRDDINTYLSHEYSAWSELVRQSYYSFLGFSSADVVQTMKNRRRFFEGVSELDGSKSLGAMQDMMYNFVGKISFHSIRGAMYLILGKLLSNFWDEEINDDDWKKYMSADTLVVKSLSDYLVLLAPIQKAVSEAGKYTERQIKKTELDYTESYKWGSGEYSALGFYEETINQLIKDVSDSVKQATDGEKSDEELYVYISSLVRLGAFFGLGVPTMPEAYDISTKIENHMKER